MFKVIFLIWFLSYCIALKKQANSASKTSQRPIWLEAGILKVFSGLICLKVSQKQGKSIFKMAAQYESSMQIGLWIILTVMDEIYWFIDILLVHANPLSKYICISFCSLYFCLSVFFILNLYFCFAFSFFLWVSIFIFPNQFYWFPRDGSLRRISQLPSRYPRFFSPPPWKSKKFRKKHISRPQLRFQRFFSPSP